MTTILECRGLVKSYGRTKAVAGIDLSLEENVIYGLLGRNGAGKTTLLNLIGGGIYPDSGWIEVEGGRLKAGEKSPRICYVKEKNAFLGGARVMETLEIASAYYPQWDWDLAKELIKAFRLDADKKMRQLSRGMESLVGNIVGLASRAPLTVYDEPVLGLDVLMREKFYRILMEDYAENPRTIFLSTHLIDEIASVVEKIYIMDGGKILLHEAVDTIREQTYLLRGNGDAVEFLARDKRVIYRETYGSGVIVAVYDRIDEKEKQEGSRRGVICEELPLQKFFAYLISGGDHVE